MKILAKLHASKLAIEKVKKNSKNPHFKNTYADLNALLEAVEPVLLENGLLLLQPITENRVWSVVYDIESDEKIESYIDLPASINPQQMGSAITYYRRYTLQSLLSLQAVDDDANMASKPSNVAKPPITTERVKKAIESGAEAIKQLTDLFELTAEQKNLLP